MLFLVTGQPGNGKTLYALNHVERIRQSDSRPVYYHGVKGLTLPWLPCPLVSSGYSSKEIEKGFPADAPDWASIPDGAVILLDEAHTFFPPRAATTIARPYVQFLAEHRHRGFDVFLVTQGVKDIDGFLRSRVGKHYHLDRRFGVEGSRLWQWERCVDPTSRVDKREGQSSRWSFPKESYAWYTSSVEHTHKKDLPWGKIMVIVGASLVVVLAVAFFLWHFRTGDKAKPLAPGAVSPSGFGSGAIDGRAYWGAARIERVTGVPQSAAIYDGLQKAKTQPRVEGCFELVVSGVVRCECSGANGASLDIPVIVCVRLVRAGWFDETRVYDDVKAKNIAFLNSHDPGPDIVDVASNGASRGAGAARDDGEHH